MDSCTRTIPVEEYDTTNLYDKIDGYETFFKERGFVRCAYVTYAYPNPLLKRSQQFGVTVNEMAHPDSAKSIYQASLGNSDTVLAIDTIGDEAIVYQGLYNYGCFLYRDRYYVEFENVPYDTTTGAQEAIIDKFVEFCDVIDQKILSNSIDFKQTSRSLGLKLFQNYPNPASGRTWIEYRVPENGYLRIFNIKGELVRSYWLNAGMPGIYWDLRDRNNADVPDGIYIYKFKYEERCLSHYMIVIH
jgi:hypothetical protein